MKKKFLIVGATGSVGRALTKNMKDKNLDAHLISKNEQEITELGKETGFNYSIADVLNENFLEKIEKDLSSTEILGIAYCVGSIDLKPINLVSKKDYLNCLNLNFFPVVEIIKKFQENLKRNKSSIVLFSTIA